MDISNNAYKALNITLARHASAHYFGNRLICSCGWNTALTDHSTIGDAYRSWETHRNDFILADLAPLLVRKENHGEAAEAAED